MSRYYPASYYSFVEQSQVKKTKFVQRLKKFRGKILTRSWHVLRPPLRWLLHSPVFYIWLDFPEVGITNRILDVGSGAGVFPQWMASDGFLYVTGADPYAGKSTSDEGVNIIKGEIQDLQGEYDFIMLNHSFEHLPDPLASLSHLATLLGHDGYIMIRTPVANSYAWETYRENWVQLDAPRHLHIHTLASLQELASKAGLQVEHVLYDSDEFQFLGSERNKRECSMQPAGNSVTEAIVRSEKKKLKRYAKKLNTQQRGDQACFYLRKIG